MNEQSTKNEKKILLALGYGFCARHLVAALDRDAWDVIATVRSADKAESLRAEGLEALVYDGTVKSETLEAAIGRATHLLISAPPKEAGDPFLAQARGALVANAKRITWAGYLSTTGVYGDRDGEWVDESADLNPSSERGLRRVKAERAWLDLAGRGLAVHIFRLAGIYGPGRNAIESVKAGTAKRLKKPGHVFSRIHVADVAGVLLASMAKPHAGRIYNVCDDHPSEPEKVVDYAAGMLGVLPPPLVPFEDAELSAMARSFYEDNKRVMNGRMKEELDYELRYPDYRAGLKAIRAELRNQAVKHDAKAG